MVLFLHPKICILLESLPQLELITSVTHDEFYRLPLEPPYSENMDPIIYQSLTGHLILLLKTRDEIFPNVYFLCTQNGKPTKGAFARAFHFLRYLKASPVIDRVFYSMDTSIYEGALQCLISP